MKMKTNIELEAIKLATELAAQKAADRTLIISLHKCIHPNGNDINNIYEMYKKYVDNGARPPKNGCNSCGNSIANYWRGLCSWWNANQHTF